MCCSREETRRTRCFFRRTGDVHLASGIPFDVANAVPGPVTGGLLFSILFALVRSVTGIGAEFDLDARDVLLVYFFFTTIGINASFRDLLVGAFFIDLVNPVMIQFFLQQF